MAISYAFVTLPDTLHCGFHGIQAFVEAFTFPIHSTSSDVIAATNIYYLSCMPWQ